jgi:hypothetical protein
LGVGLVIGPNVGGSLYPVRGECTTDVLSEEVKHILSAIGHCSGGRLRHTGGFLESALSDLFYEIEEEHRREIDESRVREGEGSALDADLPKGAIAS